MDMYSDNNDKLIKKNLSMSKKLSLLNLIMTTIICSAPSLWLILRTINNETNIVFTAILTIIAVAYMIYTWCKYFYEKRIDGLEKEIEELERRLS